jgi:diguanylate cyclase (GGDEF)-like protein
MKRVRLLNTARSVVTAIGTLIAVAAVATVPHESITPGFFLVLAMALLVAHRISLTLPRSNLSLGFSDSIVFLSFVLYGGHVAVISAFIETGVNCLYLKRRGVVAGNRIVLFNAALAAVVTAVWCGLFYLYSGSTLAPGTLSQTRTLFLVLGLAAIAHFVLSSLLAAVYEHLKSRSGIWETWKEQCISISLTQLTGAGMAGVAYKLITNGDPYVLGIAAVGVTLLYFTFRQSLGEITKGFNKVEDAEREKATIERTRRQEAERHAHQLSNSLEQQEKANAALRKSRQDFKYAALHDSLTGLANRKQLVDMLSSMIGAYKADPSQNFHVLFLDLQRFKNINDTLGHTIGDKVLMIAAKRFVRMLTPSDTVARLGGDEFAIILRNLSTVGKAQKVARRIANSISQPFSLSGNRISVSVHIGIAPCDAEYETPEDILRDADIAMHFAKERNIGAAVFTKELRERFQERANLELDLRHAVERGELSMHYQPIVSLREGRLIGFEALLRWNHSERGSVPPNKFIPIAEESGLIVPITNWILNETCSQLARWRRISPACENLIVSVNISSKHLAADDLVDDVELALDAAKLPADLLKLEVTESAAMENAEHTIDVLNRLKKIGVQLSLDDFGTGYSSLSHLHRLPFDTLKIDRSFVSRVGENGENSEILQTIISLAKNLKMRVIAEGIETESQFNVLRHLGCDLGQGYLLAKPQTRENAEKMIYESRTFLPYSEDNMERSQSSAEDATLPVF